MKRIKKYFKPIRKAISVIFVLMFLLYAAVYLMFIYGTKEAENSYKRQYDFDDDK